LWYHLSEKGTAGVVMANGAMTTGSAGEKNVREYMIKNGMVDCIVQMPDKLFLTTGIPACLFILSKNRNGRDGEHRERKKEILFIDARKLGHMVNRRLRVFSDDNILKVASAYHQWRSNKHVTLSMPKGNYLDVDGFCKAATMEEVSANNYVLSPGRYVGTETEEDDGISFEEKMNKLTGELAEQFEESKGLELQIKENLKSVGFDI
jgi:type I restriction enzyme M protein